MKDIKKARKNIDKIDKKMAKLFEKRMKEVLSVADYKAENGLETEDSIREKEMIKSNSSYIKSRKLLPYYTEFLKQNIIISKKYQSDISAMEREKQ